MTDYFLFEFSRTHCVAICAFLVPANLLATLQTLIFVGLQRPQWQIRLITAIASLYALTMVLHVATWLMVGVVMLPTFILLGLGCVCLLINGWAIASPHSMSRLQGAIIQALPSSSSWKYSRRWI